MAQGPYWARPQDGSGHPAPETSYMGRHIEPDEYERLQMRPGQPSGGRDIAAEMRKNVTGLVRIVCTVK